MRYLIILSVLSMSTTTFAGSPDTSGHAANPLCSEEKEKALATAQNLIEDLGRENALLQLKVLALEDQLAKIKIKPTGAKQDDHR